MRQKFGQCQLCQREKPLSFHHLIPRTNHSNKWFKKNFTSVEMKTRGINLCKQCHYHLHKILTEKELGRVFNTLESLQSHEGVRKFVEWVKKR